MFTGIIEALGELKSKRQNGDQTLITLSRPSSFDNLKYGSSIACNGICLTVVELRAESFTVQVMNETVKKTTVSHWQTGERINLERALKLGDRLDGHWVQGHVDKTALLLERTTIKDALYLKLELPVSDRALMIPQGSIAVNGVSLTVAELSSGWFKVALIGHTLQNSNLSLARPQSRLNLEYDVLGKYILGSKSSISKEWLHEQGF
ncbi:MAG TPA: riboflavin synthase [Candidatus Cloacimonadota bacterium]|nr:riboflavin synthase [Candidatus Cloacimonadota bacterium]